MTKKRLSLLYITLSPLFLILIFSQVFGWGKSFSYLQPDNLPAIYGKLYFSGQPSPADIETLKEKGFDVIINIRGPQEMTFDEQAVVKKNDMSYYNLPLLTDGRITDAAVTRIFAAIKDNNGKKILLHCSSGNRVASWFGATLVRDLGYQRKTAIELSKKAGMTKHTTEKSLKDYLNRLVK